MRTIVGSNLNLYANNGQFETDRSTWGFPDPSWIQIIRSNLLSTSGIYSARCWNTDFSSPPYTIVGLVTGRFLPTVGKNYVAKIKARVPSSLQIADNARVLSILYPSSSFITEVQQVTKTIADALDTWVDIETYFTCIALPPFDAGHLKLDLAISGSPTTLSNPQGFIYLDQYEIYEYIEEEDPDTGCDVDLDDGATTVTNESSDGAADGQIEVAATGTGTLEYSKGGTAWQTSDQFPGLTTGIFIMRVRKQTLITCVDEWPFALNHAAVAFDFTALVTHESISGIHDGAISITVTGTGGPFEYSINAGVSWQPGNNFSSLTPGVYYVAVRNADGNSIVKVITVNAGTILIDKVYHSKNPIVLSKSAISGWGGLTNYRLYNEVRVEDVADSGNYNAKMKVELTPNVEGVADFYLKEAFRDAFTLTPPGLNESEIIRLTDRIKRFKNYSGEMQETELEPEELTASVASLVLWGGISKFHFPTINYFTTYLQANKKFLTWAPVEKYVNRLQEDYLNFWVYGNFTALKLRAKVHYDDGTNETAVTKTKTATQFTQLYQIPAGPVNSGALAVNPAKNATKYELSLLDQTDAVISEVRTYHINLIASPLSRYIMAVNSLGAFEVHCFKGKAIDKSNFDRVPIQKFLPHDYSPLDGEFSMHSVNQQRETSLSSGYITDRLARQWHEYMQDLLGSPIIYNVTNGDRYPVIITGGDFNREDQNYERFIRIDAKDAYENESFTPDEI